MNALENSNFSEKPHVLVIDDDDRIRDLTSRFLQENGFIVVTAENAKDARHLMTKLIFDVLVVDIMMPGETGLEFTKSLRENDNIPIILLTALGEAHDRVKGLETGADDYLPKPFDPRELVLRIQAILKRTINPKSKKQAVNIGNWLYDPVHKHLQSDKQTTPLTQAENRLLQALLSQKNSIMPREKLARLCNVDPDTRTIDVQVTRLRKKINSDDDNQPQYLQTVRGEGYRLIVEDT